MIWTKSMGMGFWSTWGTPIIRPEGNHKHTKNDGQSQFSIGKSTISLAIFNSYVSLPEGNTKNVNPKPSVVPFFCGEKSSIKGYPSPDSTQDLLPTKTALFVVAQEPQIRGSNVDHGPIRGGSTSKGAALRTGGLWCPSWSTLKR